MIDIEDFVACAKELVRTKLNDEITAIDAARSDGITLKQIDIDNAIIFQSLDNFPVNFDPVLYYGVSGATAPQQIESATGENWEVEFTIILADPHDKTIDTRLFRYQRALKNLFKKNYFKINNLTQKVRVKSLDPVSFSLSNQKAVEFRAIGVIVETTLFN